MNTRLDAEFWRRHLNLGLVLYGVAIACSLVYLVAVPGPSRHLLYGMAALALVSVAVVLALPRHAIVESPRRLVFFYSWSAFSIAFVLAVAALDGGATSPLALLLLFALVYSALAYPPYAVVGATTLAATGYLAVAAVTGHAQLGLTLMMVVVLVGVGSVSAAAAAARDRVRRELDRLATHDGLTGCLTHRAFHDRVAVEVGRSVRHGHVVALVLVDLDHFKAVNDANGHLAGDEVLRRVGAVLGRELRPGDAVGRVGGDEFALLLPETDASGAVALARRRLAELTGAGIGATFGVAQSCGRPTCPVAGGAGADEDARLLVAAADRALYGAKTAGRGRVQAAACACDAAAAESA
ncbi:MAG TPA: diguanylate cyclase [Acidimicrobiia bacterium]|nr:diguanylate cyclase [Acidimicrobiia bacterium]